LPARLSPDPVDDRGLTAVCLRQPNGGSRANRRIKRFSRRANR
jgi:hypothetical protein